MSHTEPLEHGMIFLQRLPYLVVANIEQMFYNNYIANLGMCGRERVVTLDGREAVEYPAEMTSEEYRIELDRMFRELDDNRLLRYFYIFVSEKINRAQ
nr:MAG TPA: hypothetical protein [Caudoviricetes sp.]